jgi:two-component system nitrate/nitrite sensor histidine kinase NarX
LATALLVQARAVGKRAKFKVHLTSTGQACPLAPVVQQQLLYILQEALANVEKHAHARRVEINLAWTEAALTVTLADDGRGFPMEMPKLEGHFGLAIMQERAQQIKGHLTLSPGSERGVQLSLRLPLTSIEGVR